MFRAGILCLRKASVCKASEDKTFRTFGLERIRLGAGYPFIRIFQENPRAVKRRKRRNMIQLIDVFFQARFSSLFQPIRLHAR